MSFCVRNPWIHGLIGKLKLISIIAVVGALIFFALHGLRSVNEPKGDPVSAPAPTNAPARSTRRATTLAAAELERLAQAPAGATNNAAEAEEENPHLLGIEEVEAALARFGTNAESLLAATQLSSDLRYLRMAATNFPNDPAVQFAIVARKVFPEQEREWIERFKTNAPDNAMAGYLSAVNYMDRGEKDLALEEFADAVKRPHFDDYWRNSAQAAEELLMAAGRSRLEALQSGMEGVLLPELAPFKKLTRELVDAQKAYAAAGDTESAEKLMGMNYKFAQTLSGGEGSGLLINQLVGYAMERIILSQADQNRVYNFIGMTPTERIAQLQAERNSIKELTASLPLQSSDLGPDNPLMISYFERMKLFGEHAAMLWMKERRRAGN